MLHYAKLMRAGTAAISLALAVMPTIADARTAPRRPAASMARVHRAATPASATAQRPTRDVWLSTGQGERVSLPGPVEDLWVADPSIADVYVTNARQINLFGKGAGETTVFATGANGAIVYSANIHVGKNYTGVDQMLHLAMPEANITATPMNGLVLLTGTVAAPEDAAEAERLTKAFVGGDTTVVSRLKTATPMQVNLRVKVAEVSRALSKEIGNSLTSLDRTGGSFGFTIGTGRNFGQFNSSGGITVTQKGSGNTLGFIGKLFGLDIASALDLAENDGLIATLAEPNLTALSGETANFLAGGELPIPMSSGLGTVSVEYKTYGVSLQFTPTVLADGRISLKVKPEVSELSYDNAIQMNGFTVPGVSTRRAETTVEVGSGQSFIIGGLLKNTHQNSIAKTPGLGDVPVLGAMFRSNAFRRNETELMIIVTPYLVKPVSPNQIVLPTDGYVAPNDAERVLLGQTFKGNSGAVRPQPSVAPATTVRGTRAAPVVGQRDGAPAPGFSQ